MRKLKKACESITIFCGGLIGILGILTGIIGENRIINCIIIIAFLVFLVFGLIIAMVWEE